MKGGQFERDFSRQLSLWWTYGEREDCFWRTSNSGGRATVRARVGKKTSGHCGDIGATDEVGRPFTNLITLELKRGYSRYTVADLLDKGPKAAQQEWEKWYIQATEAAERAGTPYWMIVQRRDQRIPFVFMPKTLFAVLLGFGSLDTCLPRIDLHAVINGIPRGVSGITLDDFLSCVKPDHIRKLNEQQHVRIVHG